MDFEELRKKFEGEVVTDDEFELLNSLYDVEYVNSYGKYYGMYKYSAYSEEDDDYFDFYY